MPVKYTYFKALNAADASTNQTSAALDMREDVYISVHNTSTGTATGTVKLQGSNDQVQSGTGAPVNWVDIPSKSVSVTAASNTAIDSFLCTYMYVRAVYTFSSGTGTITVQLKSISW